MSDDPIGRFQRMLDQNPTNGLARFSLAKALFDAQRPGDALTHFQTAVETKPDWMLAHILLGKCHLQLGARQAARTAFERGLQLAIEQNHQDPQTELETLIAEIDASTG